MFDRQAAKEILVIEDNDDDYEATERALNSNCKLPNPIRRCRDGLEAWAYLSQHNTDTTQSPFTPPGLILLDLNMPGLDGHQLLKRLKDDKQLCNIPVVVMTTSTAHQDVDQCYEAGANTYVNKPVDWDEFKDAVQNLRQYWFQVAVLPENTH